MIFTNRSVRSVSLNNILNYNIKLCITYCETYIFAKLYRLVMKGQRKLLRISSGNRKCFQAPKLQITQTYMAYA
jgi:hypothetical protein